MAFHSIQGQSHAIEVIRRALAGGRLHHAYLFAGPAGVGKTTTARAFAKALLCTKPTASHDACGQCGACIRVGECQHADLHIIERKSKSDGLLVATGSACTPRNASTALKLATVRQSIEVMSWDGRSETVTEYSDYRFAKNTIIQRNNLNHPSGRSLDTRRAF